MADIDVAGPKLPFVLGGAGRFTVHISGGALDRPLEPGVQAVFDIETHASAGTPLAVGGPGSWTLSLKTSGGVKLIPVRAGDTKLLEHVGLADYFAANPDSVVLALTIGGGAEGSVTGKFRYAALTAAADLDAASDLTLAYLRPYAADTPLGAMVQDFFGHVRVPATAPAAPPAFGEVIRFEYGGYLKFGGGLGLGYEISGTPSASVGELLLSERYDLSVIGKLSFAAQIAGFFSVDIRGDREAGWVRVIVRKRRASQFTAAADASVDLLSDLEGLPSQPNEFLGALLGVNPKNWLNVLGDIAASSTWEEVVASVDALAMDYLTEWLGDVVGPGTFQALVAKAKSVAGGSQRIDSAAIDAFDRMFGALTDPATARERRQALEKLASLTSWNDLRGEVDPRLWNLVTQLTGGDPLGWILERDAADLRKRAQSVLELADAPSQEPIRSAIRIARAHFNIGSLFEELGKIRSVQDLEAAAGTRLGGLVQRLLGADLEKLERTQLGRVLARLHEALAAASRFEQAAYARFKEAARQTLTLDLHAQYSRSDESEALIDVAINTADRAGPALLRDAALGSFENALSVYRPALVRLNAGRLTHNLVKQHALNVNVVGWHSNWRYQGVEKLLLKTDQQIVTSDRGGLTVYTTTDLALQEDKRRQDGAAHRRTFTNFLVRFLGESHGVVAADPKNMSYLIEALTRMSASYDLGFQGDRTRAKDLSYYLSFAKDFGLTGPSLQVSAILPLLPARDDDDYGPVSATYSVRYSDAGLKALASHAFDEPEIRRLMRQVILGQYLHAGGQLARVGWTYWTPGVYTDIWRRLGPAAFVKKSAQQFGPIASSPFGGLVAPESVVLPPAQQETLNALYLIEDGFVDGLATLQRLVARAATGQKMTPKEFERALGAIGEALEILERFGESVNTTFAVFDALVSKSGERAKASSLTLQSRADGRDITKIFVSS